MPDGGADRREPTQDAAVTADSARSADRAPAAISRNITDAVIRVEEIDIQEGNGYLMRGTVVSATPVGGRASIAEAGQSISLTPYFPEGAPDLSKAAHRRLMEISATPRGASIRCRIALDDRGSWRIVSAE